MDTVTGEDTGCPVVHLDRKIDGKLSLGMLKNLMQAGIEP